MSLKIKSPLDIFLSILLGMCDNPSQFHGFHQSANITKTKEFGNKTFHIEGIHIVKVVYVSGIPKDYQSSYGLAGYFRQCSWNGAVLIQVAKGVLLVQIITTSRYPQFIEIRGWEGYVTRFFCRMALTGNASRPPTSPVALAWFSCVLPSVEDSLSSSSSSLVSSCS